MFSYIKGLLTEVMEDRIVVETGGVGWNIYVPLSVLDRLPGIGQELKVYTSFQVREDAMTLYGFLSRQDQEMFRLLLGVNGVGPKAALGILSVMRPDDLRIAVISEDVKGISRAPGIGAKTAKRVILDLKDKIRMEDVLPAGREAEEGMPGGDVFGESDDGAAKEAIQALVALGYSLSEATKAVRQVKSKEGMTAEAILKASLKYLIS